MGSLPPTPTDLDSLLARCSFPAPGTPLDCAVSGGADSLGLLVLAAAAGCEVTAWHVDHGLREGSSAEADVVAAAADRYGARFTAVRAEVAPGPNLEARARDARYAVLPPGVAVGHTADDLAETMLLNLLRGAGLDGLAPMLRDDADDADDADDPADTDDEAPRVRRPLLGLRRAELRALCEAEDLAVVDDPSNADPAFVRNRIRHELLPLLDAIATRDVVLVLVRQALLLRDDADLLDELAAALDPHDARALAAAPLPLARRAVRRLLAGEHPPDAASVERVLAVARNEAKACEVYGGVRVRRSGGRLFVERP